MCNRHKWADEETSECACRELLGSERGTWCGNCLWTRMGQNLDEALADPDWRCPPCLDLCNCSGMGCTRCRHVLVLSPAMLRLLFLKTLYFSRTAICELTQLILSGMAVILLLQLCMTCEAATWRFAALPQPLQVLWHGLHALPARPHPMTQLIFHDSLVPRICEARMALPAQTLKHLKSDGKTAIQHMLTLAVPLRLLSLLVNGVRAMFYSSKNTSQLVPCSVHRCS